MSEPVSRPLNIVLDIETLGTKVGCPVISIGAISDDGRTFYRTIDIEDACRNGTPDGATIKWWMRQTEEALVAVFYNPSLTMQVLSAFASYLTVISEMESKEIALWGNGSDFDNAILADLYTRKELKIPWSYKANRCFRTLKNLYRDIQAPPADPGHIKHHALHDAIYEMNHLKKILEVHDAR